MARTLLLIFLINFILLSGQGGFRSRYQVPGSLNNSSFAAFEISPGNYFAAGTSSEILGNSHFGSLSIMGLDQTGNMQWIKKYGSPQFSYLFNPLIRRRFYHLGNEIYYIGCARKYGVQIGVLIKFASNGDTLWQKEFTDPQLGLAPQMLCKSQDGGLLITGYYLDFGNPVQPGLLLKTDSKGNELWRKVIHKTGYDSQDGRGIAVDSASKKIVIVGSQRIAPQEWGDNILILDSLGNKLSQFSFADSQYGGVLQDVIQTRDKNFVAVGTNCTGVMAGWKNKTYSYILKFSLSNPGQPLWVNKKFDVLSEYNQFHCLKELPDGKILVAGVLDTMGDYNYSWNIHSRYSLFNSDGTTVSNKTYNYGPVGEEYPEFAQQINSVELTSDGGWIAAIEVQELKANPFLFVKYDAKGCDSSTYYCETVGLDDLRNRIERIKLYPQPASTTLNIENGSFEIYPDWTCQITNVLGEKVSEEIRVERKSFSLNVEKLASGVYFLNHFSKVAFMGSQKFTVQR